MEKILLVLALAGLVVLFFYLSVKNKNTHCDIELPDVEECSSCDNIFCHNRKDASEVKEEMKELLHEEDKKEE